jgi:hypothetical protein
LVQIKHKLLRNDNQMVLYYFINLFLRTCVFLAAERTIGRKKKEICRILFLPHAVTRERPVLCPPLVSSPVLFTSLSTPAVQHRLLSSFSSVVSSAQPSRPTRIRGLHQRLHVSAAGFAATIDWVRRRGRRAPLLDISGGTCEQLQACSRVWEGEEQGR